jgi:Carboxypeptidase regulatory-like domain
MRAARRSIPLLLLFTLLGRAGAEAAPAGVGGRVLSEKSPLAAAGVYIYQLADLSFQKVQTDAQGNFLFKDLPAGLYKVVAHKAGFVPVILMLTRTAAQNYQEVELQLTERPRGAAQEKDDFWSVRSRIPGDVLREIERDEMQIAGLFSSAVPVKALSTAGFSTDVQAMTGVDQISAVDGQVSGAGLGIQGSVGSVQVGLRGSIRQVSGNPGPRPGGPVAGGQTSSLSLDLKAGAASRISVMSLNNRLILSNDTTAGAPVDFERYQVNYSQDVGEKGRSDFAAQYTAESNFHRQGPFEPLDIPEASRTWLFEGAYTADLGDRNTLQAGLRYHERQLGTGAASLRQNEQPGASTLDLFGRGGLRVQPAVLLEYGLYSTLADGSLSLSPQGGIVLQLGPSWQLEASGRQRVYEDVRVQPTFLPTLFAEGDLCEQGSEACYQVSISHKSGDDNSFALSATHRKVGDTLRLYFNEELFDRLESLYLVRGDELPELRLEMTRKLSPQVLTTISSSLATGGGGMFVAANRRPYENQVKYMVTALDTQFLSSQTGVFVAFHHLAQELQPLGPNAQNMASPQLDLDRVRVMLTQDLGFLFDFGSDWAVQLDMELSRGPLSSTASSHDNELRGRLMGGIAVKF